MSVADERHPIWDAELDPVPLPEPSRARHGGPAAIDPSRKPGTGRSKAHGWIKSVPFAFVAGIAAPIVCLTLDPFVFKGGDEDGAMLGEDRVFAYGFIGLETAVLATWLASRGRLGPFRCVVSGMLLAGAFFAACVGAFLFPYSLLGTLFLIGLLGFTPLFTAYVYLNQGKLAWNAGRARTGWTRAVAELCLGVVLAIGPAAMLQSTVHGAWRDALEACADGDESAPDRVKFWRRIVVAENRTDLLDRVVENETDPVRKERLERALWE